MVNPRQVSVDYTYCIQETIYSLSMIGIIIIKQFGPDLHLVGVSAAPLKAGIDLYKQGKWT